MSIQTITRQELLNKVSEAVKKLPDDSLQQVWEQVDLWVSAFSEKFDNQADQRSVSIQGTVEKDTVEFDVAPHLSSKVPFVRLPIRTEGALRHTCMEIGELTNDSPSFAERLQVNIEWWNNNFASVLNDASLYHKYVAISDGNVFSGNTYLEAYKESHDAHIDGVPYIFFLNFPNNSLTHAN